MGCSGKVGQRAAQGRAGGHSLNYLEVGFEQITWVLCQRTEGVYSNDRVIKSRARGICAAGGQGTLTKLP